MKNIGLPVRFGLIISGILIAYFLVLSLFNKHTNPAFSFLNAVITAFGIYETIRYYKLEQGPDFSYTKGIIAGIVSGFIATAVFSFFFLFYITEINSTFLSELVKTVNVGYDVSVGLVTFTVAIMGFATTVISALTVMQYFKKSWNIS
jgi:glycerol uptake facilitator-like aquaporin